jgi:cystathionine beta-synthase
MDYFETMTDVVGNTPLVRLGRVEEGEGIRATILAKLEYMNPGGSVKDRPPVKMLEVAEKEDFSSRVAPWWSRRAGSHTPPP